MKYIILLASIGLLHASGLPSISDLTLNQKIGQLFMVATASDIEASQQQQESLAASSGYTNPYQIDHEYIEFLITEYGIGGVIFLYRNRPDLQIACIERWNSLSALPLLVGLDAEWGPAMRHPSLIQFPRNLALGAIQDDELLYEFGKAVGAMCKELGVHIVFAPVIDVNNNPKNPVIHDRSFGDDPSRVSQCAKLVIDGLHHEGVMACMKHFPGHGDVSIDSHIDVPCVAVDRERLNSIELKPFKDLSARSDACMIGHLLIPAIDAEMPATFSKKIISVLRNDLSFDGLVVTDGLGMGALTNYYKPGEIEMMALRAGNDILLCPVDVPRAVQCIKDALANGMLDERELDAHVEKILMAKKNSGLFTTEYHEKNSQIDYRQLKKKLYQAAICGVGEAEAVLVHNTLHTTCMVLSDHDHPALEAQLSEAGYQIFYTDDSDIRAKVKSYKKAFFFILTITRSADHNYGIPASLTALIHECAGHMISMPILFGTPYSYTLFKPLPALIAFDADEYAQRAIVAMITQQDHIKGVLPIAIVS